MYSLLEIHIYYYDYYSSPQELSSESFFIAFSLMFKDLEILVNSPMVI